MMDQIAGVGYRTRQFRRHQQSVCLQLFGKGSDIDHSARQKQLSTGGAQIDGEHREGPIYGEYRCC